MLKMKMEDIYFWYDIHELNATTEEIVQELSTDKNGKRLKLPKPEIIKRKVLERIAERNGTEIEEEVDGQ